MVAGKASRLAKSGTYAGKIPKGAESGDKLTRFSSQCRAGNLKILRGLWNEDLFRVLEGFADLAHDDEVDVTSGALGVRHLGGTDVGCDTGYRSSRHPISGQRRKLAASDEQAG